MEEIKQYIKTAQNPQELHEFMVLCYDNFLLTDEEYNEIESCFDASSDVFF